MTLPLAASGVLHNLPFLGRGVELTALVSVLSIVGATVVGLAVAGLRLSRLRLLRFLGGLYVDTFRSTPLFVQLLWLFYVMPILTGVHLGPVVTGTIGLTLYSAPAFGEVFRTGILSLPEGQREAGLAQGMTGPQAMRRVILPQAVRRMLPPVASAVVTLVKDSSIVSVIGVAELFSQAQSLASFTFDPFLVITITGLVYALLTLPLTLLANAAYRRSLVSA
jgi:polar amino acid transport system permease protein